MVDSYFHHHHIAAPNGLGCGEKVTRLLPFKTPV
jgi:hypothetical protein